MKWCNIIFMCGLCQGEPTRPNWWKSIAQLPNYYMHESADKLILNPLVPIERQNIAFAGLESRSNIQIHQILVREDYVYEAGLQKRLYFSILFVFKGATMKFRIPSYGFPWISPNKSINQDGYVNWVSLKSIIKKMLFNQFNKKRHEDFSCFIETLKGSRIDSIMEEMIRKRCDWLPKDRSGISCDLIIQNQTCAQFLRNLLKMEDINYCKFQRLAANTGQRRIEHPLRSIIINNGGNYW